MALYKIYISNSDQSEAFELPVLPEEISITEKSNNKNHTLQNLGEITIINTVKLGSFKIKGLLPTNTDPYISSRILKQPIEYIDLLKKWRDSKKPLRIVIAGTAFPFTWACTLESLTYKEVAGEVGDIYYSIDFKEYRYFNVKKVVLTNLTTNEATTVVTEERPVEKETPATYTVQSGDTLYAISKKQLGNGNLYKELATNNDITNPNLIYPGQVLIL